MALRIGQGWVKSSHSNPSQNCVEVRVEAADDEYRTSSRSGGDNGSQCVEVALLARCADVAFVRDSKHPTGPRLRLPVGALAGLVELARE